VHQQRKIIHIDMDAFYAAVEQRDFPEYRGRPVVVGGSPTSRGVVATCSYEARRFGIHSAMPAAQAKRLCPQALFLRPRFEVYKEVSRQIQRLFHNFTSLVEPLSLDEAYLDVSHCGLHHGSATLIARAIKRRIHEETGLSASAGISYNKFLAKIASDMDKPDGLYLITPERGPTFTAALPVGRFHGVGRATERRMTSHGIHTGADLARWSLEELQRLFGKAAHYYFNAARGIDERPVLSERVRKSMGSETTFDRDLADTNQMLEQLERLAAQVARSLRRRHLAGRTLTVKVRYQDFQLVTRSVSFAHPVHRLEQIRPHLDLLLARTEAGQRRVRLLGVSMANLCDQGSSDSSLQLDLFDPKIVDNGEQ
jgi:DNA polymerase-4